MADVHVQTQTSPAVATFMAKVYAWMTAGLGVTAATSAIFVTGGRAEALAQNPLLLIGIIVAELALVFGLSFFINKISAPAAMGAFVLYAGLNGVVLSLIVMAYTTAS